MYSYRAGARGFTNGHRVRKSGPDGKAVKAVHLGGSEHRGSTVGEPERGTISDRGLEDESVY